MQKAKTGGNDSLIAKLWHLLPSQPSLTSVPLQPRCSLRSADYDDILASSGSLLASRWPLLHIGTAVRSRLSQLACIQHPLLVATVRVVQMHTHKMFIYFYIFWQIYTRYGHVHILYIYKIRYAQSRHRYKRLYPLIYDNIIVHICKDTNYHLCQCFLSRCVLDMCMSICSYLLIFVKSRTIYMSLIFQALLYLFKSDFMIQILSYMYFISRSNIPLYKHAKSDLNRYKDIHIWYISSKI